MSVETAGGTTADSSNAGPFPWRIYAAMVLSALVAASGITVIYNMLATLYRSFPGDSDVGWVVTIYWLSSGVVAAVCGRLGDLLGRRRVLLAVLVLCTVGAITSASTDALGVLILGCAIQGIAAAVSPLNYGVLRENLPPARMPAAIGVMVATGMIGSGVIYLLSGIVIDQFSWQGGFWFKVGLSALAYAAIVAWIPDSRPAPGPRIDMVRGLLFAPGLVGILLAVQKVGQWGVGDWRVCTLIAGGLAIIVVWARQQWHAAAPLINVRAMADRRVLIANGCMAFLALGGLQLGQVFSTFLQQPASSGAGFGLSATSNGAIMLALNSSALLAGPLGGRITHARGARTVLMLGLACIALAWGSLIVWHDSFGVFVVQALFCSIGLTLTQGGIYSVIVGATPPSATAEATGLTYVFLSCFFAIGAQSLFSIQAHDSRGAAAHGAATSSAGFAAAFAYVAVMAAIAFALALRLPRERAAPALRTSTRTP